MKKIIVNCHWTIPNNWCNYLSFFVTNSMIFLACKKQLLSPDHWSQEMLSLVSWETYQCTDWILLSTQWHIGGGRLVNPCNPGVEYMEFVCMYICIEVALCGIAHLIGWSNWAKGRDPSGSWVQFPNPAAPSVPRHSHRFILTQVRFLNQLYPRQLRKDDLFPHM